MPPAPDASASLDQASASAVSLLQELRSRHIGDDANVEFLVAAFFAGGHVLIEGAPGLGKTRLIHGLAQKLGLSFGRIQCTPDLMPFDITGSEILAREGDGFQFLEGPVFTNILLADEINRATPRTQSALLEAMEERQVTAGTKTHSLPNPFFVAATQNPIELEGTYPLPEAQLDRFIFKLELSRPSAKTLQAILELDYGESSGPSFLDEDSVKGIQELVALMPLPNTATAQIAALISATHPEDNSAPEIVRKNVRWGASPRAGLAILAGAQSLALLRGRAHVSPEDLRDAAVPALRHRIALRYESVASGVGVSDVISEVLKNHSIQ